MFIRVTNRVVKLIYFGLIYFGLHINKQSRYHAEKVFKLLCSGHVEWMVEERWASKVFLWIPSGKGKRGLAGGNSRKRTKCKYHQENI